MRQSAVAAAIGAAFALLLCSAFIWPEQITAPGTARLIVGVGVIGGMMAWLCHRQDQRHREIMRVLSYRSVADEAEEHLRGPR